MQIAIILVTGGLLTVLLTRFKYNLRGFEAILAAVPGISIGINAPWNTVEGIFAVYMLMIVLLAYYYLLRIFKCEEEFHLRLLLIYFVLAVVETVMVNVTDYVGFDGVGAGVMVLSLNAGICVYVLMLSLVNLVAKKIKQKCHYDDL